MAGMTKEQIALRSFGLSLLVFEKNFRESAALLHAEMRKANNAQAAFNKAYSTSYRI